MSISKALKAAQDKYLSGKPKPITFRIDDEPREALPENPEREMFLTHTPTFFTPGKVIEGMLITRQERIGDTALIDGGRAPCWRILGREVTVCTNCGAEGFRLSNGLCDGCHDAQKTANDEDKLTANYLE